MQYFGGDDVGMKYNVPVQSLIDHIKTALDVDPWAKEMVEELLKEQEAVEPVTESSVYDPDTWFFICGSCKKGFIDRGDKFCRLCGRSVKWDD